MIKRMARDWLVTVGILAGIVHGAYLATHTNVWTYRTGVTVSVAEWSTAIFTGDFGPGIAVGTPGGHCAGIGPAYGGIWTSSNDC